MESVLLEIFNGLKGQAYLLVLIALCFEFIPSELILPLAGSWIEAENLNIHLLAFLGAIGGTLGPLSLFALSRWKGRAAVIKYGKWFLITEVHIEKADNFFGKYGAAVAFFARFMPLVRTAISVPCGLAKMSVWKFSLYTFLAAYPLTYLYLWLGKKLGDHWGEAGAILSKYSLWFAIAFVLVIAVVIYFKRGLQKKITN